MSMLPLSGVFALAPDRLAGDLQPAFRGLEKWCVPSPGWLPPESARGDMPCE